MVVCDVCMLKKEHAESTVSAGERGQTAPCTIHSHPHLPLPQGQAVSNRKVNQSS